MYLSADGRPPATRKPKRGPGRAGTGAVYRAPRRTATAPEHARRLQGPSGPGPDGPGRRQPLMHSLPNVGFSSPITLTVSPQTFTGTWTGTWTTLPDTTPGEPT